MIGVIGESSEKGEDECSIGPEGELCADGFEEGVQIGQVVEVPLQRRGQSCVIVGYLHFLKLHSEGLPVIIVSYDDIHALSGLDLVFLWFGLLFFGLETMLPLWKGVTIIKTALLQR